MSRQLSCLCIVLILTGCALPPLPVSLLPQIADSILYVADGCGGLLLLRVYRAKLDLR
ncbi:MAG: hypothetical protein R2867_07280 [Caldilineaceae bacterium]